ncbi:four helix bundle protein [candidate division WOR-3 bacterium]|uniref:Four helix bundle protein n=1 Tax=candidate division WOR-3 bacterium TaxID=2052148 RepID=A0A937XJ77_UNCW3|nr:four helix bundle protein [candidate division WOR-3 bacterium]
MDKADKFDLERRTTKFGVAAIRFCQTVSSSPVTVPLLTQLVRAATSIGANYAEANDAESPRDFRHKIGICRKESRECKHWLTMLAAAVPTRRAEMRELWQEAKELNLIFGAALRTLDRKQRED